MSDCEYYMKEAIKEAEKAYKENEVPVGAVIVYNNKIIARGHNQKEKNQNVMCHAEINAILKASKKINNWRLDECDMYVTLEPCPMCASAIQQSRISKVYYALRNSDFEIHNIVEKIFLSSNTNPGVQIFDGILEDEYKIILKKFFKSKRM